MGRGFESLRSHSRKSLRNPEFPLRSRGFFIVARRSVVVSLPSIILPTFVRKSTPRAVVCAVGTGRQASVVRLQTPGTKHQEPRTRSQTSDFRKEPTTGDSSPPYLFAPPSFCLLLSALCSSPSHQRPSVFISGSARSPGLSRRLLVKSTAGANVELVSSPSHEASSGRVRRISLTLLLMSVSFRLLFWRWVIVTDRYGLYPEDTSQFSP